MDDFEEMNANIFHGCIPALMTPCDASGDPNYDALVATAKRLVEVGMRGVVYCGSMGDWPLLTNEQRQEGVSRLAKAGVPVVVGTGAQSPRQAVSHAAHAREVGAAGLMVIPRVLSRGISPAAQRAHFADILRAGADLPAVIYNSPYYGFETKADLFFDLNREFPNLIGFKEFGGVASLSYAAENITNQDPNLTLMVGVDTQVFHGYVRCGAAGGDAKARRLAGELDDALSVLSKFDEGPDLVLYYKQLMVLEGHSEYGHHIHSSDALSNSQRELLQSQWEQFRSWWDSWQGNPND